MQNHPLFGFLFDTTICNKCQFQQKKEKPNNSRFLCSKINDYIGIAGNLCCVNTMIFNRKDLENGFDSRVLLCPYFLEHLLTNQDFDDM